MGLVFSAMVLLGCPGEEQKPPDAAPRLVFTLQPSNTTAGTDLSVQVAVQDAQGHVVSDSSATVTLGLAANPAGGVLLGTTTVNATQGVATFSVHVDKAGNGYALSASAPGLMDATSNTFDVSPGAPSHLVFTVQPTTNNGPTLSPAVEVSIQDRLGNTVSGASGTISLALGANPGGGTLSGTTSVATVNGVATFSNLRISEPGEGYTLVASGPVTAATSAPFTVLLTPVTGTRVVHHITDTGQIDQPFDFATTPVGAYVAEADGGFTYYPGTGTDAGTFSIPGVPFGGYYLRFRNDYVFTSERSLDLSLYEQGRPDVQRGDAGALVHTTLTGMNPWQDYDVNGVGITDELQMYSSNAGAVVYQLMYYDADGGLSSPAIPKHGDTTFDQWTDYATIFERRLVDADKGDRVFFTQLVSHDAGVLNDAGVSTGTAYQSLAKVY
ncbi:MAG TPA: hypothetical protein VF697_41650, partial [Archangium sp.]